jgi:tetratricopeptide (TPR) repeat protein
MIRWIAILALFPAWLVQAGEPARTLVEAGVAEFNAAYQAWDGARFATAAELLHQASTNMPASPTNFYWLGVAQFHRMLQLQNQPEPATNKSAAPAAMDAAVAALGRAVKLDPRHAESHALLGTLYGMKIDGNLVRAAWYGPRVEKHRKAALEFGAESSRVRYLLGTCQFHTAKKPAALREALATLLKAEKLFAAEAQRPAGALEPRWGYATCLTFIGRTYELLDQPKEAAEYFRKALARQPSDHLAKQGLTRVAKDK